MNTYLDEQVPDPTDFPADSDAPGLRSLDEALRCTICQQFTIKQECPLCRQAVVEVHIRRNPAVEDILKAWKLARPFLLGVLEERQRSRRLSTPPADCVKSRYFGSPSKKRRRKSNSSDDEVVETAGPTKVAPLVQCPICSKEMTEDVINRHLDNNCRPVTIQATSSTLASPKKRKTQKQEWSRVFGGDTATATSASKGKARKRPAEDVDLDSAEPIPKMAYDTVSAKTIRERLNEYSLPAEGEKPTLVLRHQRWVSLFNANLDASASERKTLSQLVKELKKREENEGSHKARKNQPYTLDINTYEKDHKSEFAQLIEQARPKSPKRRPGATSPLSVDVSQSNNAEVVACAGRAQDTQ
ncbi:hypothetical protein BC835DRAFT_1317948 [Cytidiella melzeri]|nr:hypothetical protein BC835DRAFT_1317948 [Cytidiella melzeri]